MRKSARISAIICLAAALAVTSACAGVGSRHSADRDRAVSPQAENSPYSSGSWASDNMSILSGSPGPVGLPAVPGEASLPLKVADGEEYVEVEQLIRLAGFRFKWDDNRQTLKFGDNDAAFELKLDSVDARKEDDQLRLKNPPRMIDGVPCIPVSAVSDLLTDELVFAKEGQSLMLKPSPEQLPLKVDEDAPLPEGSALDFGDDPEDPYKQAAADMSAAALPADDGLEAAVPAAVLKDINIPALIARARTYLGVRYEFGAEPYPKSGTFDCSTYTAYLFDKYGIALPRTARAQAKLGNTVSRSSLRVGDLLYFYVPGRFQTNKTVGHVGIYIGNRNMIHASPEPKDGVQITSIDKAYWKRTFLLAKRIAK
ncbi:C40 family peptidase [Paenibacillus sp. YN15]|uniref:C40 family peptidase n=1 Tax=Paenibacillus sp. YN15 TaxID=1742774 RepID=UPI000DCF23AC|nr:C40 family peptidase [Paenibacillus sp. YN15]RAV06533.1 peptidoglycan endopeptidase [Paenibacillus sp. YN15]